MKAKIDRKQMLLPSFSESHQIVMGNLKMVMAVSIDEEESEAERESIYEDDDDVIQIIHPQ